MISILGIMMEDEIYVNVLWFSCFFNHEIIHLFLYQLPIFIIYNVSYTSAGTMLSSLL